jgi:translation initiation factor 2 subunit 1
VANILGYKTDEELESLYRKTAWQFEAKTKKKGSSYDWFKQVRVSDLFD